MGGLANALQFECAEYLTAFLQHLKYGVVALYARTLRKTEGLSKREATDAVRLIDVRRTACCVAKTKHLPGKNQT